MLELVTPTLEDLWFRESLMADEETMAYNHAWGGTIPFPKERWEGWYDHWIVNHENRRYYRYLKSENEFVGEIAYHYDSEYDGYVANVIVFSKFRGKGYGARGLELLCKEAQKNGITSLYDDIAIDNTAIKLFLKQGFYEVYRTEEKIVLRKDFINPDFRGAAYILENDDVVLEHVSGFRDFANELPNTIDTKFASASAGKVFVAVGILQLIEQGKLHLDDTIGKLIDIDWKAVDKDITVEQLLNHTSGIPDYFDESVMDEYEELWVDFPNYKIRHNDDLLPLFIDKPMMYPKGTKFQYNNTGYVVLAMIIERVTGVEFDQYLKESVFDKCGMTGTGYYEMDKLPAKCATNYVWCNSADDLRTNIFCVDAKGTGAGGAFITVKDIVNFWKGLRDGKLLSKEMTETMLSKHSGEGGDPEEGYYGYGVWIIDGNGQKDIPYFQGCDPGVSFISEYNPNENRIMVFVSNYGDNVWAIARDIRNH